MSEDTIGNRWSESEEQIMEATRRALLQHGYAQLSISRIADELNQSKASLYYHYDSKEDLLQSFLEFTIDQLEANIDTNDEAPNRELEQLVEALLPLQLSDEESQHRAVMVELRSQAVMNDKFREQFTEIDDLIVKRMERIIDRGIDEGVFRNVDSGRVAEHIFATTSGATYNRATTDRTAAVAAVRVSLLSYINNELIQG